MLAFYQISAETAARSICSVCQLLLLVSVTGIPFTKNHSIDLSWRSFQISMRNCDGVESKTLYWCAFSVHPAKRCMLKWLVIWDTAINTMEPIGETTDSQLAVRELTVSVPVFRRPTLNEKSAFKNRTDQWRATSTPWQNCCGRNGKRKYKRQN